MRVKTYIHLRQGKMLISDCSAQYFYTTFFINDLHTTSV